MLYNWNFRPLFDFLQLWSNGLLSTLWLTATVIFLGTILSLVITCGLFSRFSVLRILARCYVDLFRAIPALVLLGTLYFLLPLFMGLRVSSFNTAVIGLALNLSPFVVECIRSAVESIPTIQYDSATVMGFRGWRRTYYIIGPQAMRRLIPTLVGQYITTLKLTALAATIGVQELWNVTSQITTMTALPIETRLVGASLYVALVMPLLMTSYWLERRFGVKGLGQGAER